MRSEINPRQISGMVQEAHKRLVSSLIPSMHRQHHLNDPNNACSRSYMKLPQSLSLPMSAPLISCSGLSPPSTKLTYLSAGLPSSSRSHPAHANGTAILAICIHRRRLFHRCPSNGSDRAAAAGSGEETVRRRRFATRDQTRGPSTRLRGPEGKPREVGKFGFLVLLFLEKQDDSRLSTAVKIHSFFYG